MFFEGTNNYKLHTCEALLRRAFLHADQQMYIEDLMQRIQKGNEGEHQLLYFLKDLNVDGSQAIFTNFETMKYDRFKYQMDAVYLCERFVLIIESKHIAGNIYYDESTHQLWREYNGQRLTLKDPFAQVMRHEDWMLHFLHEHSIDLPVFTCVVITTNNSTLNKMPDQFAIFKLPGLRLHLQKMLQNYPKKINYNMLQRLFNKLIEQYKPQKWQHPFQHVELKRGAICHCGKVMHYRNGYCHCECGYVSKKPLLQGLLDYQLLVNEWITNKQFRQFFNIENDDVCNKILKRIGFSYEGKTKSRKYLIDDKLLEKLLSELL